MLTDKPCLAHYAKDKCKMVTTDASKIGLGITLWQKQNDGEIKPIAFGSRYLNDTEINYSIGELELLAVDWGLEKVQFYLYGKKVFLYTDYQALEPLIKRNRSNHQYSARLTRWLYRLPHFDIAVQHIAGKNLKFTDYLSRNPLEGAPTENKYDEEYVTNILSEHAKLNAKYGSLFDSQLERSNQDTEIKQNQSENKINQSNDQSHQNRTFQNKHHVNKTDNSEKTTSGLSEINTAKTSPNTTSEANEKMNRENMYHWGATREIMDIIRKRNKSPETRRLVERREALAKPGTMRRRYDTQSQRMIFTPSRPNKKSRDEIAEIDAEFTQRAHRIGGGYRPLQPEEEEEEEPEAPEEGELQNEQNTVDTEEDSVIMRGDNLPIVDLSKYHTDGKEAHHIQINHIVGKITENKKLTEENIKKAEFNFMLDLKTLISKTAIDPEMTRVRASMRREEKDTAPEGYRPVSDKLSIRWGLVFVDDQIAVPIDLRRKLIEILHFGHSGTTKMLSDAKIFWWPEMREDIEQNVKDCTACLATGKNLKYQIPKNQYGKLEKLSEPGQELQIDFTGKLHNKKLNGEPQILIAIDRFSKWPTAKICRTSDTKEIIEIIKSDEGGAFILTEYKNFCKSRNIEIQYCPPRMHTGNGTVERAIQTMKNLILANMEDGNNLTESVNRALRVMRFTILTGLKKTPFELHHGRKPRTELTYIIKTENHFYQIGQNYPFQHRIGAKYRYMSEGTPTEKSPTTW